MSASTCQTPPNQMLLSAELRAIINERNILSTKTRMKVLHALDNVSRDSQRVQQQEQEKLQRWKAIQEILTSEASYLHQLEILMKFFMDPLKVKDFVSLGEWNILFGNVETLYKVNGALLEELKANPQNVASAFLKLAPYFKLYSVYAYDYKQVVSFLQEVHRNNPRLAAFILSQETRPEVSSKLASLLIVPIQRIPRYRLLLREVLNHTTPFEQDYYTLQSALKEVERTAEHINGLIQEQENMEKMVQLQKSLHHGRPGIITPGRKFIKEGILMKVSSDGRRPLPRYFVLFSDMLIYCTIRAGKTPSQEGSLRCCCVLPLKHCTVQPVLSQGVLRLSSHGETLILYSTCVEDTKRWLQALQQALKQYHANLQTLRKDSSSRRPLRHKDLLKLTPDSLSQHIIISSRKRKNAFNEDLAGSPGDPIVSSTPADPKSPETPDQRTSLRRSCFPDCRPSKIRRLLPHLQQTPPMRPPVPQGSVPLRSSLRPRNSTSSRKGQRVRIVTPQSSAMACNGHGTETKSSDLSALQLTSKCDENRSVATVGAQVEELPLDRNLGPCNNHVDSTSVASSLDADKVDSGILATWSPFTGFQSIGNMIMGIQKSLRRSLRRSLFRFTPEIRLQ